MLRLTGKLCFVCGQPQVAGSAGRGRHCQAQPGPTSALSRDHVSNPTDAAAE